MKSVRQTLHGLVRICRICRTSYRDRCHSFANRMTRLCEHRGLALPLFKNCELVKVSGIYGVIRGIVEDFPRRHNLHVLPKEYVVHFYDKDFLGTDTYLRTEAVNSSMIRSVRKIHFVRCPFCEEKTLTVGTMTNAHLFPFPLKRSNLLPQSTLPLRFCANCEVIFSLSGELRGKEREVYAHLKHLGIRVAPKHRLLRERKDALMSNPEGEQEIM